MTEFFSCAAEYMALQPLQFHSANAVDYLRLSESIDIEIEDSGLIICC